MGKYLQQFVEEEVERAELALKIVQSQEVIDENLEQQAIQNLNEARQIESFVNSVVK